MGDAEIEPGTFLHAYPPPSSRLTSLPLPPSSSSLAIRMLYRSKFVKAVEQSLEMLWDTADQVRPAHPEVATQPACRAPTRLASIVLMAFPTIDD